MVPENKLKQEITDCIGSFCFVALTLIGACIWICCVAASYTAWRLGHAGRWCLNKLGIVVK